MSPPPPCPDHRGKVIRYGTYGKRTAKPRQRYRCTPADGSKPHVFTPPLPRDHVHAGSDSCEHCEELRGVHRGETAVARRHSWSTRVVARGLEQLSAGASYADVSRWALRVTGNPTRRRATTTTSAAQPVDGDVSPPAKRRKSPASAESHNVWHIAAGWAEVFAPVVYAHVETRLRDSALVEHRRLDALAATAVPADRPQVWLLDDAPVYGRDAGGSGKSRRDAGFFVLVLAEVEWGAADSGNGPPVGRPRLRLVRAMAKSNKAAWRMVFAEMGYEPDFVVADSGTGIAAAIDTHFDPGRTRFVPSLWHLTQAIHTGLQDTPGAFTATPAGKALRPELDEHLRALRRGQPGLTSVAGWAAWWDQLERLLTAARLPRDKIRARRRNYEQPMVRVLPELLAAPHVPVSTGGLETLIAKQVQPLLAMRRSGFGNIERTNNLFDLVVARAHGAFDDLSTVIALLRDDAREHEGWTVPLRAVADPRPRRGVYASLRDASLLASVAAERGLA